jgi:hypothetical protein
MATTLTVASGPLTAVEAAQDDAKAQEVLRLFAFATGANTGATNQQILDHVARTLRNHMVGIAQEKYRADRRAELVAESAGVADF